MLGSAAEAEDVVQDVWVRWQTADRSPVRNPLAFLATATTRLAINVLQSARARRETVRQAHRLPEPVDTSADPGLGAERGEALNLRCCFCWRSSSPTERAAYMLREAFDYPYRDIADTLRLEEANVRQVVTSARQHVANGRRMPASSTEQRRLFDAFIAAVQNGDVASLEGLSTSDVVECQPSNESRLPGTYAANALLRKREVLAALTNFHSLANGVWTTEDTIERLLEGKK